jgi:hypothetical protein
MSKNKHDLWAVMAFAGLCGIYFGLTTTWQIAVESAQVLAGVVTYPDDNPFYMYHVKSWTLLHQIPALLLSVGLSERVVSHLIGCAAAVLCVESLALVTFAFSRNRLVACGAPLVCLATKCFQDCGAVYPIRMLPDVYWTTYGVTGTYYVLFVWSLTGVGLRRPAAFLCGLAPAVHPALGSWCIATVGCALVWQWWGRRGGQSLHWPAEHEGKTRREGENLQFAIRFFAAGLLLTAISFAVQQYLARHVPAADPILAREMLEAFVDGWDNHRFPVPLDHVQWQIGWCVLVLATVALWQPRAQSDDSVLLLRMVIVTTLAGLAMCWLTWCTRWLPLPLVMAMPGRFLNFAVVLCPPLVIGLAWRWRAMWSVAALFAALMLYCVLRTLTVRMELFYVPPIAKVIVVIGLALVYLRSRRWGGGRQSFSIRAVMVLCLALSAFLWRHDWRLAALVWLMLGGFLLLRNRLQTPLRRKLKRALGLVAGVCPMIAAGIQSGPWLAIGLAAGILTQRASEDGRLFGLAGASGRWSAVDRLFHRRAARLLFGCLCLALVGGQAVKQLKARSNRFNDWHNDAVFAAAGRSEGLLLTAPRMGIVQLRSRRGILLNGEAMNQLTYVPASGPGMNRMLNEIYGDDLLTPRPVGWVKAGGLMRYSAYELWQNRTPTEWQRLANQFGFRHIVTYPDWKLNLPLAASSRDYLLYEVPGTDRLGSAEFSSKRQH